MLTSCLALPKAQCREQDYQLASNRLHYFSVIIILEHLQQTSRLLFHKLNWSKDIFKQFQLAQTQTHQKDQILKKI